MLISSMILPTLDLENELKLNGYSVIVGVDEAGRGPLAGPVVAGAVLVNENDMVVGVRDSKKMSEKQREQVFEEIKGRSKAFGIGIVSSEEIDSIGIQRAVLEAMRSAIFQIHQKFPIEIIIADGKNVSLIEGFEMKRITKGDMYHYSISAGSILAKVTRDRMMKEYAIRYPDYGFEKHMGYGTKKHIEKIYELGVCDIHRKTFEPIKSLLISKSLD